MPYYCTVPRCTSMAGKAVNVSFHQFPRDRALAEHWNTILRRGKPWTKYSKVCSLHFTPADYTVTSVGKNKGQWRTLRKDAIPSRNLPHDSSTLPRVRSARTEEDTPEQQMQQQLARAVYMQTMLAVHAATLAAAKTSAATGVYEKTPEVSDSERDSSDDNSLTIDESRLHYDNGQLTVDDKENSAFEKHEKLNDNDIDVNQKRLANTNDESEREANDNGSYSHQNHISFNKSDDKVEINVPNSVSKPNFKCEECPKCFIDPDVFIIHKRWHATHSNEQNDARKVINKMLHHHHNVDSLPDPLGLAYDPLSLEQNLLLAMRMNMQSYIENIMTVSNHLTNKNGNIVTVSDNLSNKKMSIGNNFINEDCNMISVSNSVTNENGNVMAVSNESTNENENIMTVDDNLVIDNENTLAVVSHLMNENGDNVKVSADLTKKSCSTLQLKPTELSERSSDR